VFGCGGDRDKSKRPLMGEIACKLADKVIITSDNPRTEDPKEIIKDILRGCTKDVLMIEDREKAIVRALDDQGPVVLIAGKGHEDYQIIGTEKRYFSDQEVVRRVRGKVGI
jgi:UDP-N-acetylmuramoyl-L-alanyl-D-glutamate--2,6-diaminopimelate ligase